MHGKSKHEVPDYYFEKNSHNEHHSVKNIVKKNLYKDFNIMLTNNYFNNNNISSFNPNLKDKFSVFRDNDIKVTLNTDINGKPFKNLSCPIQNYMNMLMIIVCADDVRVWKTITQYDFKINER